MSVVQLNSVEWTRKHDKPGDPLFRTASILYPQSLADVIEVCVKSRPPNVHMMPAGSHWALSPAAVSDWFFVETNDPNDRFPAMGRTLYDVVPGCLTPDALRELGQVSRPFDPTSANEDPTPYYVHVEAGKRIYQLYAELDDAVDDQQQASLAWKMQHEHNTANFLGRWALKTLGGAGGQTVWGALTTGTHGGDIRFPPIADAVRAIHLVVDGGRHYLIEPEHSSWIEHKGGGTFHAGFTDSTKLTKLYGQPPGTSQRRFPSPDPTRYPDAGKFEIIREDNTFNAVLMSPGRFGIIYSAVLQVVRQYGLHEERRLADWQDIEDKILKGDIDDPNSLLYDKRFLQIVINLAPHKNGTKNRCAITKRWNVPLETAGSVLPGRDERVGRRLHDTDSRLNAPLFENAGHSAAYDPKGSSTFFEKGCSDGSVIQGIFDAILTEFTKFVNDHVVQIIGAIDSVMIVGGNSLPWLAPALAAIFALIPAFLEVLRHLPFPPRLGQVLDLLRKFLLDQPTPERRAAGILLWRAVGLILFESQQNERDYEAVSYAVMDVHDYFDKSCTVNVDSVEVFFDATDTSLIAFVDQVLRFEAIQEFNAGKACVGYIALRFLTKSRALLAPERHTLTCAVEIAGLKDTAGSGELVDFATRLSRHNNINGVLHWGQRHEGTQAEIEHRFGDDLRRWRAVLSRLTDNGRLNGFSSLFTRIRGLEIVTPKITLFTARVAAPGSVLAHWDCSQNPPESNDPAVQPRTSVRIDVVSPSGRRSSEGPLGLTGDHTFAVTERGTYRLALVATIMLNGSRETRQPLSVTV
jgi:hypothetical protein